MGSLQQHILHLHKSDLGASLVLIQLRRNIFDICLRLGDEDMLECIHEAPCLFDLCSHELAAFLNLRKLHHVGQDI